MSPARPENLKKILKTIVCGVSEKSIAQNYYA
jgi:hypothetical protein